MRLTNAVLVPALALLTSDLAPLCAQVVIAPELQKFAAPDPGNFKEFGVSVDLSGNTLIVGAEGDSTPLIDSGAAYVYTRSSTGWEFQAKLKPEIPVRDALFGHAVSIDGDVALIGASEEDRTTPQDGAAYIFTRQGTTWSQQARLIPGDVVPNQRFGTSLSLSGNRAVVGAPRRSGAVYVFERQGTTWSETAGLRPPGLDAGDEFGIAVDISGSTLCVGARVGDFPLVNAGSVYMYEHDGTSWNAQPELIASDFGQGDGFGVALALVGDTLIVGTPFDEALARNTGSAYVFQRTGSVWNEEHKLTASDSTRFDRFGASVALEGDRILIGATGEAPGLELAPLNTGRAYLFERDGTGWQQQVQYRASDFNGTNFLGTSVALLGDQVILGAPRINPGFVYAYEIAYGRVEFLGDFCTGDGGDQQGCADCPCDNNAAPGTISGCRHGESDSLFGGRGARLVPSWSGESPIASLGFELQEAPPNSLAVLLSGPSMAPAAGSMNPCATLNPGSGFGQPMLWNGLTCLVSADMGPVLRHGNRAVDSTGAVSDNGVAPDKVWGGFVGSLPNVAFAAGETRHFQAVFRDRPGVFCGTSLNSSQGVSVRFSVVP